MHYFCGKRYVKFSAALIPDWRVWTVQNTISLREVCLFHYSDTFVPSVSIHDATQASKGISSLGPWIYHARMCARCHVNGWPYLQSCTMPEHTIKRNPQDKLNTYRVSVVESKMVDVVSTIPVPPQLQSLDEVSKLQGAGHECTFSSDMLSHIANSEMRKDHSPIHCR